MKSRCCEIAALECGVEDVAVSSWHRFWKFSFPGIQNCRSDIWTEPSRCSVWPTTMFVRRPESGAQRGSRPECPESLFFSFLVELSLIPVTHPQARLALEMENEIVQFPPAEKTF